MDAGGVAGDGRAVGEHGGDPQGVGPDLDEVEVPRPDVDEAVLRGQRVELMPGAALLDLDAPAGDVLGEPAAVPVPVECDSRAERAGVQVRDATLGPGPSSSSATQVPAAVQVAGAVVAPSMVVVTERVAPPCATRTRSEGTTVRNRVCVPASRRSPLTGKDAAPPSRAARYARVPSARRYSTRDPARSAPVRACPCAATCTVLGRHVPAASPVIATVAAPPAGVTASCTPPVRRVGTATVTSSLQAARVVPAGRRTTSPRRVTAATTRPVTRRAVRVMRGPG